jgi:YD repeat-containing protein
VIEDKSGPKKQTTTFQYDSWIIGPIKTPGPDYSIQIRPYRRIRRQHPDTYSQRNGYQIWHDYDGDGNQTYIWMGSDVIKNEYDDLGRLAKSSTSKNGGFSFTPELVNLYDDPSLAQNSLGRLAKTQLNSGSIWYRYDYDERGRVKNREVRLDGNQFTMSYTYDSADWVLSMTDPQGKMVQYTYYRMGQLNTAWEEAAITYDGQTVAKAFGYNPRGQMTDIYYGHGASAVCYNDRGWITVMKDMREPGSLPGQL